MNDNPLSGHLGFEVGYMDCACQIGLQVTLVDGRKRAVRMLATDQPGYAPEGVPAAPVALRELADWIEQNT